MKIHHFKLPSFRRAGMTIVEMMIAAAISSLVMIGVTMLQYDSARTFADLSGQIKTRSSRNTALDEIRYRLMDAKIGTCVVSNSNSRIDYTDPTEGSVTSAFYFNTTECKLYYDNDTGDSTPASVAVTGPINITFSVDSAGAIVNLAVRSQADMAYGDVDTEEGTTMVYLRNI